MNKRQRKKKAKTLHDSLEELATACREAGEALGRAVRKDLGRLKGLFRRVRKAGQ